MELLQLTYFCDAAESENFSKTARRFMVPPSNISQSIQRLEKELGQPLFDRMTNKITLNEQGKIFYKSIREALSLIKNARMEIDDKGDCLGEIKILCETDRRIVTEAIENFQKKYDNVSFFINHTGDINTDEYDFLITDKIINKRNFEKKKLVIDRFLLAMEKANPLNFKKDLSVKDLKDEKFITMNSNSSLYYHTEKICKKEGFVPNIVIKSEDPAYIRKYVEMGLGIAFVPSVSWKGMFSDNVVLKSIVDLTRTTFVYYPSEKYLSKAKLLFLKELEKIEL